MIPEPFFVSRFRKTDILNLNSFLLNVANVQQSFKNLLRLPRVDLKPLTPLNRRIHSLYPTIWHLLVPISFLQQILHHIRRPFNRLNLFISWPVPFQLWKWFFGWLWLIFWVNILVFVWIFTDWDNYLVFVLFWWRDCVNWVQNRIVVAMGLLERLGDLFQRFWRRSVFVLASFRGWRLHLVRFVGCVVVLFWNEVQVRVSWDSVWVVWLDGCVSVGHVLLLTLFIQWILVWVLKLVDDLVEISQMSKICWRCALRPCTKLLNGLSSVVVLWFPKCLSPSVLKVVGISVDAVLFQIYFLHIQFIC